MPSTLTCSWPNCAYTTQEVESDALAVQLLMLHAEIHKQPAAPPPQVNTASVREKIRRPTIDSGSPLEMWTFFLSRWSRYKKINEIQDESIPCQLLECLEEGLLLDLHRNYGSTLDTMQEQQLLAEIKRLAVKTESTIISRVNMRRMTQDHQEDIRHFAARLRGQATLCEYLIACPSPNCQENISYAEAEIGDQLCAGIADPEIQKEVLGLIEKHPPLEELIAFIETKETGKRSQNALGTSAAVARISQYKKERRREVTKKAEQQKPTGPACVWCGEHGHGRRAPTDIRKSQCPGYKHLCTECDIIGHLEVVCHSKWKKKSPTQSKDQMAAVEVDESQDFIPIGGIELAEIDKDITISYAEYDNIIGWISKPAQDHPLITVTLEVSKDDYKLFNLQFPDDKPTNQINRIAVADTGAMTMVAGRDTVNSLGLDLADLVPVKTKLKGVDNNQLNILGAVFLKVGGKTHTTRQLCYIINDDNNSKVYLSRKACENLGIISKSFPRIGDHSINTISGKNDSPTKTYSHNKSCNCDCPKREKPPLPPTTIPFPATPENHSKLKEWILNHYKSSTFNICENQGLTKMSGPPLEIDIDPSITPTAVHTPIPVPIHWRDQVKAQLDRDVKLGVIEEVPWAEPTTWCSRMVGYSCKI